MAAAPTPTPKQPSTWDLLKGLASIPSEMRSAGAGLKATSDMLDQATQKPAPPPPAHSETAPQDLSRSQGPYGSRPGEKRLDSEGNVMPTGLSGVRKK